MKRILSFCLFVLTGSTSYAASIKFVNSPASWNAVVQLAKQSNKRIFVDAYTTWCGPCKKMDAEVFTNNAVGDYFNSNFINVKIDAEKSWGIEFAKTNKVDAYPTYIFFNPQGKAIYTALGFMAADDFLKVAKRVVTSLPSDNELDKYAKQYTSGKYDADFLKRYLKIAGPIKEDRDRLLDKYIALLPESLWPTDSVQRTIAMTARKIDLDSYTYKALLAGYQQYNVKAGLLTSPWNIIKGQFQDITERAGKTKDKVLFEKVLNAVSKFETDPYARARETNYLNCVYYATTEDPVNFAKYLAKYYEDAIANVDRALLYKKDKEEFERSAPIEEAIAKRTLDQFKVSFRSEAYLTQMELHGLAFFYYKNTPGLKSADADKLFKKAILEGIEIYRNNPIHVNQALTKKADEFNSTK